MDEATLANHRDAIAERGYTVIAGVVAHDEADAMADDLRRLEADLAVTPADNTFEGRHTVRIYNLLAHGPRYEAIPVHPEVLPVVEAVLDAGCLVSSLSSIGIDPGGAVGVGEVGEGPHRVAHGGRVGLGQGDELVVGVEGLGGLAGVDADG